MKAAERGDAETVQSLLAAGVDPKTQFARGWTAFMFAAVRGHERVMDVLLKAGARIDERDRYGNTALMNASFLGRVSAVRTLLRRGADVNASNHDHDTPLILAADGWDEVVAELIARGAKVNTKNHQGYSALWTAATRPIGPSEIVKKAGVRRTRIVQMLLEASADPDTSPQNGFTPLMGAARWGNIAVVRMLLTRKADVHARDDKGRTALSFAEQSNKDEVAALLRKAGAKT